MIGIREVTSKMLDVTKKQGAVKLENLYLQQWKDKGVRLRKKYSTPVQCSQWGSTGGGNSGKARMKNKKKITETNNRVIIISPTGKIRKGTL